MKTSNHKGDKPFQKFYKDKSRQDKAFPKKERRSFEDAQESGGKDKAGFRSDNKKKGKDSDYRGESRTRHVAGDGRFRRKSQEEENREGWKPKRKFNDREKKPFSSSEKKSWDKEKSGKRFGKNTERPSGFKRNSAETATKKGFGDRRRTDESAQSRGFEKVNKDFSKKSSKGKQKSGFGKFDEQDLSFGKKKVEKPKQQAPQQEEVTFRKEVVDKWQQEPVFYKHQFDADRKRKEGGKKHEHPQRKKGFENYFEGEEQPKKVYAAAGSRKRLGDSPKDFDETETDSVDGEMPLNKFIAHCGVCGRREAAMLVKEGKVKVNGELITEPGVKVTIKDQVSLSGKKLVIQEKLIYILLNKPKGFITTTDDPKGRRTVLDIFDGHIEERIYPIGRLDRNTTGLLLLTNDGDLAQKLAHPSNEIKKVYQVSLDKPLSEVDFAKIKSGVELEDGLALVDQIAYLDSKQEVGLEIHNGRNRIVRRIFESLGYVVERLDRVMYAGLTKKRVPRGQWRFLEKQEVINLKHLQRS